MFRRGDEKRVDLNQARRTRLWICSAIRDDIEG